MVIRAATPATPAIRGTPDTVGIRASILDITRGIILGSVGIRASIPDITPDIILGITRDRVGIPVSTLGITRATAHDPTAPR
ncbi:hypothetical protein [Actinoallomurus sp. NPDC052274]|uniref:hypothetical protein n=1 Tax=Actinoallomurus sp. NPDC052274 TaxID=3155420 RepID=UPI0034212E1A